MNIIGRRRAAKRATMTMASNEFLAAEPSLAERMIADALDRVSDDRMSSGRWLAWRPLGPTKDARTHFDDYDFAMNLTTFRRTQVWEWRFIGRRRR